MSGCPRQDREYPFRSTLRKPLGFPALLNLTLTFAFAFTCQTFDFPTAASITVTHPAALSSV
jgi:hypothetical protein